MPQVHPGGSPTHITSIGRQNAVSCSTRTSNDLVQLFRVQILAVLSNVQCIVPGNTIQDRPPQGSPDQFADLILQELKDRWQSLSEEELRAAYEEKIERWKTFAAEVIPIG